jgi:HEPN domain-containing protein
MKQLEQARLHLKKAKEDEALLDEVLDSPRISDSVIGFHCQQAAGKLLKSLLSSRGIRFRKTHDLLELIDLLIDNGYAIPEYPIDIDYLTPYAVEFRYELFPLSEEMKLDRQKARRLIVKLRSWIESQVNILESEP